MVAEYRPDLLITDLVLPGLDGLALLRRCEELGEKGPRIIVVSAFCADRTVAEAAAELYCSSYTITGLLAHARPMDS